MDRGMPYAIAGDAGVAAVQNAVYNEMGCVFRHQPVADVGIDGIIELREEGRLTGQLIGCQVKSGEHYFREATAEGVVFRIEDRHARYWSNYSLPVIVALHNPNDGAIFWQSISNSTLERTGKMWKTLVPFQQRLDAKAKYIIASLFIQSPYEQRIARLTTDRLIICAVGEGHAYVVEVDDWANKSIGRYDFRVLNDAGDLVSSFTYFMPGLGNHIEHVLADVFPGLTLALTTTCTKKKSIKISKKLRVFGIRKKRLTSSMRTISCIGARASPAFVRYSILPAKWTAIDC